MRVHLKGVKKVTAKLATGETKVYYARFLAKAI
jgi:hypothetical protein